MYIRKTCLHIPVADSRWFAVLFETARNLGHPDPRNGEKVPREKGSFSHYLSTNIYTVSQFISSTPIKVPSSRRHKVIDPYTALSYGATKVSNSYIYLPIPVINGTYTVWCDQNTAHNPSPSKTKMHGKPNKRTTHIRANKEQPKTPKLDAPNTNLPS